MTALARQTGEVTPAMIEQAEWISGITFTPTSITFVGRLFGETDVLSLAAGWQEATGYHRRRPPM